MSVPCPHCGKPLIVGVPVCRWCKSALEVPHQSREELLPNTSTVPESLQSVEEPAPQGESCVPTPDPSEVRDPELEELKRAEASRPGLGAAAVAFLALPVFAGIIYAIILPIAPVYPRVAIVGALLGGVAGAVAAGRLANKLRLTMMHSQNGGGLVRLPESPERSNHPAEALPSLMADDTKCRRCSVLLPTLLNGWVESGYCSRKCAETSERGRTESVESLGSAGDQAVQPGRRHGTAAVPCPQCGKPLLAGAPVCRWCKARLADGKSIARLNPARGTQSGRSGSEETDPHGRRYFSGQEFLLGIVALVIVASLAAFPERTLLFLVPVLLSVLLGFLGNVLGIIAAFRVSVVWGLAVLFVPCALLVFLATHFDEAAGASLFFVAGVALAILTLIFWSLRAANAV